MRRPPDVDALLGVPYVEGGRDWRTGLDCWGLAMARAALAGAQVPDLGDLCSAALHDRDVPPAGAVRVLRPRWQPGDIVPVRDRGALVHCVVLDGRGLALEATPGTTSHRVPVRSLSLPDYAWRWPCSA